MTTKFLAMAAFALTLTAPAAASCPLADGPRDVSATMSTVTIDGTTFDVQGDYARHQFLDTLHACNETQAALYFDRWRNARLATNATGVAGIIAPVAWVGTAAAATIAGDKKDALVNRLRRPSTPQSVAVRAD